MYVIKRNIDEIFKEATTELVEAAVVSSRCSDGSCLLELSALCSDVGLGVGARETWGGSEMSLGFSVLGSSKEESVGA